MIGRSLLKDGALVKLSYNTDVKFLLNRMLVIWKDTPANREAVEMSMTENVSVDVVIGQNLGGFVTFNIGIDNYTIVSKPTLEDKIEFSKFLHKYGFRYIPKLNKVYKFRLHRNERKNFIDY